jgi:3-methyl-2-oxobutanoate hydroxymethyltransferase
MVYHARCVTTARSRAFVLADLPFASYATPEQALANAAPLMQTGGAQMVKLEGAKIEVIGFLVEQGIPVCGHLGLLPQSVNRIGGYKVQGREPAQADKIFNDALAIEQAGAGLLILECVPATLAAQISQKLTIPVIGIGAGAACDGQVLVLYDMLNISVGKRPRFSKNFLSTADSIEQAIRNYRQAVKTVEFPATEHCY